MSDADRARALLERNGGYWIATNFAGDRLVARAVTCAELHAKVRALADAGEWDPEVEHVVVYPNHWRVADRATDEDARLRVVWRWVAETFARRAILAEARLAAVRHAHACPRTDACTTCRALATPFPKGGVDAGREPVVG